MNYEYRIEQISNGWLLHADSNVVAIGQDERPTFYKTEAEAIEALYVLVSQRRRYLNSDMWPSNKIGATA